MHFTLWPSRTAQEGEHAEISWEEFIALASNPATSEEKLSLEAWSPAKFRDNLRGKANVELLSAIALDDDSSGLSLDRVCEIWRDYAGVVHTSHSHTATTPKYRIVLQLSRDVTPEEHARLWAQMRDRARANGQIIDEQTKDPSRIWFVPARRKGGEYDWRELPGEPIDVDVVDFPVPAQIPAPEPSLNTGNSDRRTAMAAALGSAWPAKGRHQAQLALAGALRSEGYGQAEALEFLCAVCRQAGDEDRPKREKTIEHTWSLPSNAPITGWTRLKALVDPVVVDAARRALGRDAEWTERTERRLAEVAASRAAPAQPPATANPFGFETGGYDKDLPPIDYQIDGLIAKGDVVMFVAHGNSLKTWLAFSVAHAVASGRPWLGQFDSSRGRAAIVDFESGKYEVLRRLKLLGVKDEHVGDRLLRASYPAVQLTDPEAWVQLAGLSLDFLAIDSYNAASPELDENDARAAVLLQHAGRFAERTGCTVLFVHHARKGQGGDRREAVRGSTALFAACDRIFEFNDVEKPGGAGGGVVRSTMRSLKDGAGHTPADIRIELSDQGLTTIEIPKEDKGAGTPESNKAIAIRRLRANPAGLPKADLLNVLKGTRAVRLETLSEMKLAGLTTEYAEQNGRAKTVFVMGNPNAEEFQ